MARLPQALTVSGERADKAERPGTAMPKAAPPLKSMTWPTVLVGLVIIAVFFVGLGGWAATAPLAAAALAPGVVSPDGSRRTVQHLEGGIIAELLIEDSSVVESGDPLVVLDELQSQASFDMLRSEIHTLEAIQTRVLAEIAGDEELAFPDALRAAAADPSVADIMHAQRDLFASRTRTMEGRQAILGQRIGQLEAEITGLENHITSQEREMSLIAQEIVGVQRLVDQGLERLPRLLALQRAEAEIQGEMARNAAAIARAEQSIGETELQMMTIETQRLDELNEQLTEIRSQLIELGERLRASEDVLSRTVITAPVSGIVVNMRFHTVGGVIGPGEPILDIVPRDDDMLIDARVSPIDIDVVHQGLTAQVVLSAYKQRNLPRIDGTVRTVSADSLLDEVTGQPYFLARVEVPHEQLQGLDEDISLSPGMPAEVMIMTGERTALDYILEPFVDTLRRSFREN